LRSWGKHFLIEFPDFTIRIHLLMFGRYCIDERKPDKPIRLGPRCEIKLHRACLGMTDRRTFFCEGCQIRYSPPVRRARTTAAAAGKRARAGKSRP